MRIRSIEDYRSCNSAAQTSPNLFSLSLMYITIIRTSPRVCIPSPYAEIWCVGVGSVFTRHFVTPRVRTKRLKLGLLGHEL